MSKKKEEKEEEITRSSPRPSRRARLPGAIAGALISPLVGAPKNLGAALEDLRSIAEGMQVLPQVLESLLRIEKHVASLDEEVIVMRRAVQGLEATSASWAATWTTSARASRTSDPTLTSSSRT